VRLVLHCGSGASNGSDVYLNGHCDANFSDVRFTEDDGTSLLDHWLEKGSLQPGDQTVFWVEFDTITPMGTEFYLYYGNPSASSASDGEATWDFFDDFEGSAVDTDKWDEVGSPGGTVANSELTISKTVTSSGVAHGYKTTTSFDDCRMVARGKTGYSQTAATAILISQYLSRRCSNKVEFRPANDIYLRADMAECDGGTTNNVTNYDFALNTYYTYYYVRQGGEHIRAWEDGEFVGEVTASIRDASDPGAILITFYNNEQRMQDIVVDWYGVGKYCSPEPTFFWDGEPIPTPSPSATPTATATCTPQP